MKHVTRIKHKAMETNDLCAVYVQFTGNLIMNTSCKDHEGKVIGLGMMDKKQRTVSEALKMLQENL